MDFFKLFLFLILIICSSINSKATQIKNIVSINSNVITNIDLEKEVKIYELIENVKLKKEDYKYILNFLIDRKIKEMELDKLKIKIDEKILYEKTNKYINKINQSEMEEVKKNTIINFYKKKIEIELRWNLLIRGLYGTSLGLNFQEIKGKYKNEIDENKINFEINLKLESLSKTHFNKIKKDYYIKQF